MRLPSFKRIFKADYAAEDQQLISKLALTINSGLETVYEALNKKVNLNDNVDCVVREVVVSVNSSGIPTTSTSFQLDDRTRPIQNITVGKVENLTNPTTYPTSGVSLSWTQTDNGIRIDHITGLPVSNQFRLRIIAYY